MDTNRGQIRHVIMSIVNGIAALFITSFLLFFGCIFLLMQLQIDFILSAQLVILFVISSFVRLIAAILVGIKYYQRKRTSE